MKAKSERRRSGRAAKGAVRTAARGPLAARRTGSPGTKGSRGGAPSGGGGRRPTAGGPGGGHIGANAPTGTGRASLRPGLPAAAMRPAARRPEGPRPRRAAGRPAGSRAASTGGAPAIPPLRKRLSVIVTARNEAGTLPAVLREAARLKPEELIVVLNGCTDGSYAAARRSPDAIVIHCPEATGHDVGRGIGAKLARGDILLFLDGDIAAPAEELCAFAAAVDRGVDVALNDLGPLLPPFAAGDVVTRCKLFLNEALGRRDLGAASMTAVPHALSRRALDTMGPRALSVPPKAQAIAILEGLRVETAGTVDVIRLNRQRGADNTGDGNATEQMITGDHAEALGELLRHREAGRTASAEARSLHQPDYRRLVAAWRNAK